MWPCLSPCLYSCFCRAVRNPLMYWIIRISVGITVKLVLSIIGQLYIFYYNSYIFNTCIQDDLKNTYGLYWLVLAVEDCLSLALGYGHFIVLSFPMLSILTTHMPSQNQLSKFRAVCTCKCCITQSLNLVKWYVLFYILNICIFAVLGFNIF